MAHSSTEVRHGQVTVQGLMTILVSMRLIGQRIIRVRAHLRPTKQKAEPWRVTLSFRQFLFLGE